MLTFLRRLFAPKETPHQSGTPERLAKLELAVRKLEQERMELLVEWEKTRGQVLRYMKRVGNLKPLLPVAEEENGDEESDELPDIDLIRAKFLR
jgi:hypothetical protein